MRSNSYAAEDGRRGQAVMFSGSRLHAVRYKQEFDVQIATRGLTDLRTLVAFSGSVDDSNLYCLVPAAVNWRSSSRQWKMKASAKFRHKAYDRVRGDADRQARQTSNTLSEMSLESFFQVL